jgi:hypothetical protein
MLKNRREMTTEDGFDIAGVAISILATPTIKNSAIPMGCRGFYFPESLQLTGHSGHGVGTQRIWIV